METVDYAGLVLSGLLLLIGRFAVGEEAAPPPTAEGTPEAAFDEPTDSNTYSSNRYIRKILLDIDRQITAYRLPLAALRLAPEALGQQFRPFVSFRLPPCSHLRHLPYFLSRSNCRCRRPASL